MLDKQTIYDPYTRYVSVEVINIMYLDLIR